MIGKAVQALRQIIEDGMPASGTEGKDLAAVGRKRKQSEIAQKAAGARQKSD